MRRCGRAPDSSFPYGNNWVEVQRVNRRLNSSGRWERLHQGDLCQALGYRALTKYEKEGGPGFVACFEAVRSASADPLADGQTLLRWLVFNLVAFNADGHAKNLSVLHDDTWRWASGRSSSRRS